MTMIKINAPIGPYYTRCQLIYHNRRLFPCLEVQEKRNGRFSLPASAIIPSLFWQQRACTSYYLPWAFRSSLPFAPSCPPGRANPRYSSSWLSSRPLTRHWAYPGSGSRDCLGMSSSCAGWRCRTQRTRTVDTLRRDTATMGRWWWTRSAGRKDTWRQACVGKIGHKCRGIQVILGRYNCEYPSVWL